MVDWAYNLLTCPEVLFDLIIWLTGRTTLNYLLTCPEVLFDLICPDVLFDLVCPEILFDLNITVHFCLRDLQN